MKVIPFSSGLVVSCQALDNEPLHGPNYMAKMALAAVQGGAVAIRANGVEDIEAIKQTVRVPVIGIIKNQYEDSDVYITPTTTEAVLLGHSSADVISVDATNRTRPNNEALDNILSIIHRSGKLAMADVSTLDEGMEAQAIGFDIVATTLSGYTRYTGTRSSPDFRLLQELTSSLKVPVLAEGHVSTPSEFVQCLRLGAYAVVVGTAITRPREITQRFVRELREWKDDDIDVVR